MKSSARSIRIAGDLRKASLALKGDVWLKEYADSLEEFSGWIQADHTRIFNYSSAIVARVSRRP